MDTLRFRLRLFIFLLFLITVLGTLGFMAVEGLPPADAFYFSIVTIATVGYGDIHPLTTGGKILAIALIITGVGTFLGVVANATELLLDRREKKIRLQKLNMVIGLFFSELGTRLLSYFTRYDPQIEILRKNLVVKGNWSDKDFVDVKKLIRRHPFKVDSQTLRLEEMHGLLEKKGNLLLRLWENPNLLENESFTALIRAVFHLKEELLHREDLTHLPASDMAHIAGDINRVYVLIVSQWLDYMKHLKDYYPYLFSLAMRTNPFDQAASPTVTA